MPNINLDDAYILGETGAQVDKVTGLFTKDEETTEEEKAFAQLNIGTAGSNRNLLDNPWWGSGEVVNQRTYTGGTITGNTYFADRWYADINGSATITPSTSGITFATSVSLFISHKLNPSLNTALNGKTITFSILFGDGTIRSGSITRDVSQTQYFFGGTPIALIEPSGRLRFYFSTETTIRAVKLELGSVSTLANDAPPDYETELLKCMRYCQVYGRSGDATLNRYLAGFMTERANGRAVFWSPLLVEMRANPTVTNNGALGTRSASVTQNLNGSVYTFSTSKTGIYIIDTNSNITTSDIYSCATHNTGALLILSADL